uniref:Kelch repeat protein n=1 Tax=Rhabditophanes sp. KR3021 TaxID=114890 RepID=A0AC35TJK9_9BILA
MLNKTEMDVASIESKGGYSKMILFGGILCEDAVVEIDIKEQSVKTIGSLLIEKSYHSSEKIENNIFVLGGYNDLKIEKYNLETNQSEVLSSEMTCNKTDYASIVYSNKIYVIGGLLNNVSIDSVEYYEPEKMTWFNGQKLLKEMYRHDSVVVDEIIYAVGAEFSNKFQRFDPREGKWSYLADIPNKTFYTALSSFEKTISCSGGGETPSLCQVYDIKSDKWSQMPNLATPVWGAKSMEDEKSITVVGGYNTDIIQSYNKRNNTWSIQDIKLPRPNRYSSKIWL